MFSLSSILAVTLTLLSAAASSPVSVSPPTSLSKLKTGLPTTPASGSVANARAAFAKAKAQGVDPNGPMPNDFESTDGRLSVFSPDSKVALWVAAQGVSSLSKRQASFTLIFFDGTACSGTGSAITNPPLDEIFLDSKFDASVEVLTAPIPAGDGVLLLTTDAAGNECNEAVGIVTGGPGCAENLPAFDCFALVNGVTS